MGIENLEISLTNGDILEVETTRQHSDRICSQFQRFLKEGTQSQIRFPIGIDGGASPALILNMASVIAIRVTS
jgi:hypothetical protein